MAMSRWLLILAAVIVATSACKPKTGATGSVADTAPSTSALAPAALAPPPIPPEPPPPLAEKVGEVPGLEAKLAADKPYIAVWSADHATERAVLLTGLSDLLAYGTMHTDVEAAIKRAKLSDAVTVLHKILGRVGKLPADFTSRVDAHLAANNVLALRLDDPFEAMLAPAA